MTRITEPASTINLLKQIVDTAGTIAIKKLSRNDRSWAETHLHRDNGDTKSNQGGPYIPFEIRQSGFFPTLSARTDKPHIREALVAIHWLRTGETRDARLVNYSNKGKECHLTRVPREEFCAIGPASFLVIGKQAKAGSSAPFSCLVIDSADDDTCAFLETLFDIPAVFEAGVFSGLPTGSVLGNSGLTEEILRAIAANGTGAPFPFQDMPRPAQLAAEAQAVYLAKHGRTDLDPFDLPCPGDTLMEISRDIELGLYMKHHTRHYASKLARILADGSAHPDVPDLIASLVNNFGTLYKEVMLSAVQRMKARAGASFEHHVRRMLLDGKLPFAEQKSTGNLRPDFILPSLALLHAPTRSPEEALILSLKTTLRERWKQVIKEVRNCDVFLATVDDKVAAETIADMRADGIHLVVPESLKRSAYAEYEGRANVITFKEFFTDDIARKRKPLWVAANIPCRLDQ